MTDTRPGLTLEPPPSNLGCHACDEAAQVRLTAWFEFGVVLDLCEGHRAEAVRLLEEADRG